LYYVKDRKGSTRAAVTEDGIVPKEYMYYAYGTVEDLVMSPSDDEPREKFTSKEFDTEGGMNLYYFGARYHDAEAGMFTSPDPMRQYWNLYSYTGGNPVMRVDPTGMEDEGFPTPHPKDPDEPTKDGKIVEGPVNIKGKGPTPSSTNSDGGESGGYGGFGKKGGRTEYVTKNPPTPPQEQNKGDDKGLKMSSAMCWEDPMDCLGGVGDDGERDTDVPVPTTFRKKKGFLSEFGKGIISFVPGLGYQIAHTACHFGLLGREEQQFAMMEQRIWNRAAEAVYRLSKDLPLSKEQKLSLAMTQVNFGKVAGKMTANTILSKILSYKFPMTMVVGFASMQGHHLNMIHKNIDVLVKIGESTGAFTKMDVLRTLNKAIPGKFE